MKTKHKTPLKKDAVVSVRIPKDLHDKIKEMAREEDRSMGYVMRQVLIGGFYERKKIGKESLEVINKFSK